MQKYECKTCGAELFWQASENSLKCQYCESKFNISDFNEYEDNAKVAEQIDPEVNAENDMVTYVCENCGAEIVTSNTTMATKCLYCDRAFSITNKMSQDFKPDFIIPFNIELVRAKKLYEEYVSASILAPKKFKQNNKIDEMNGVYIPFWLHSMDISVHSIFNCVNTSSFRLGNDKVYVSNVYDVIIDAKDKYVNIPTDASVKMSNEMMDALEPFDYKMMKDFNPAYMAGYFAEQPDIKKEETIDRAKERISEGIKENLLDLVKNYDVKTINSFEPCFSNEEIKYSMLPVWYFYISHHDKKYEFAVNGNTGKVVGKIPISCLKLFLVGMSSFLLTQIVGLLIHFI